MAIGKSERDCIIKIQKQKVRFFACIVNAKTMTSPRIRNWKHVKTRGSSIISRLHVKRNVVNSKILYIFGF